MQKLIGGVILVAATTIGSGMLSLPMVLAKLGLLPSICLMIFIWLVMYHSALVNVELNLNSGRGTPLSTLARKISGKNAELISAVSFKALSYSLLAVFIYAGSSVLQKLILNYANIEYSFITVATFYTFCSALILLLPLKIIDYANRVLFIGLLVVIFIFVLVIAAFVKIESVNALVFQTNISDIRAWEIVLPVVFTSFGFQVIFHTLTDYCEKNPVTLEKAFFYGSLIPTFVYIVWTISTIAVIHSHNPIFYEQIIHGKVEVGEVIKELGKISKWEFLELVSWLISSLAIVTSVIGVGLGLTQTISNMIEPKVSHSYGRKVLGVFGSLIPAYFIAIKVPNAFIAVLGFAGMILTVIAILMPIYLFYKAKISNLHYKILSCNTLNIMSVFVAVIIIICKISDMVN